MSSGQMLAVHSGKYKIAAHSARICTTKCPGGLTPLPPSGRRRRGCTAGRSAAPASIRPSLRPWALMQTKRTTVDMRGQSVQILSVCFSRHQKVRAQVRHTCSRGRQKDRPLHMCAHARQPAGDSEPRRVHTSHKARERGARRRPQVRLRAALRCTDTRRLPSRAPQYEACDSSPANAQEHGVAWPLWIRLATSRMRQADDRHGSLRCRPQGCLVRVDQKPAQLWVQPRVRVYSSRRGGGHPAGAQR